MYQVYKHTSKTSGKSYIGYTKNGFENRLNDHIRNANNGYDSHFSNAIRKYGIDDFESCVVFECHTHELATTVEKHFISAYDTKDNGYNMTHGGDGGNITGGVPLTEQHKNKIRDAQIGKPKKSKNIGKYEKSQEHKDKIADVVKNHGWMHNANGPKKYTSPESKQNLVNAGYKEGRGDFQTQESKDSISETLKAYKAVPCPECGKLIKLPGNMKQHRKAKHEKN